MIEPTRSLGPLEHPWFPRLAGFSPACTAPTGGIYTHPRISTLSAAVRLRFRPVSISSTCLHLDHYYSHCLDSVLYLAVEYSSAIGPTPRQPRHCCGALVFVASRRLPPNHTAACEYLRPASNPLCRGRPCTFSRFSSWRLLCQHSTPEDPSSSLTSCYSISVLWRRFPQCRKA